MSLLARLLPNKTRSTRSQCSMLRQIELEAQLGRAEDQKGFFERNIAELEGARKITLQ